MGAAQTRRGWDRACPICNEDIVSLPMKISSLHLEKQPEHTTADCQRILAMARKDGVGRRGWDASCGVYGEECCALRQTLSGARITPRTGGKPMVYQEGLGGISG